MTALVKVFQIKSSFIKLQFYDIKMLGLYFVMKINSGVNTTL